jgi:AcrR family transcriptional regulator
MAKPQIKSQRRMGPVGSENWHAMLDSAQEILREEGHAALTSRRIAERMGVKQRLIYYYFHTMDELIVDLFQRMSEREIARLHRAAGSPRPLREVWDVCVHTTDARLVSQFMALANRIDGLRNEVVHFIEESRAIQVRAIEQAAQRAAIPSGLTAQALALLATSVALAMTREEQLGITSGHAEVRALIEDVIARYEPCR